MSGEFDSREDFTGNAWETLFSVVDSTGFVFNDSGRIYEALQRSMRPISFGEYLRRYIYRKAEMKEPFDEVDLNTYREIIKLSFYENDTPPAFEPTTAKLSALSKNWLTQFSVSRRTVFLLGFGLKMPPEDVEEFLTKALREHGINAKDPFEVICWYCFKNGYGFYKFDSLWRAWCETEPSGGDTGSLFSDATIAFKNSIMNLDGDAALLDFALKLKVKGNRPMLSVSARHCFDRLFGEAKRIVAGIYTADAAEEARSKAARLEEKLLLDPRVSDEERNERVAAVKASPRVYDPDEITESDLEHIISSAIPTDRHGNLTPGKASALNAQFEGKRFSRQHVSEILSGGAEVTRFDLITLNFFIWSQSLEKHPNKKERYFSFISETNDMLSRCFLGELYISNPYECFVLMCLLTEDPLGTYADVWELSYER